MTSKLSEKTQKEIKEKAKRYPKAQAALLPALWVAQKEMGHLAPETVEQVADLLGLPPSKAFQVSEFYSMYLKQKPGKYHLQVCQTLSCELNGSERLRELIEKKLGLKPGGITADGQFSLQMVECLAACHRAPCLQVNEDNYEDMTPEKLEGLLDGLKKKDHPASKKA